MEKMKVTEKVEGRLECDGRKEGLVGRDVEGVGQLFKVVVGCRWRSLG